MMRTSEEKAADDALAEALERTLHAHYEDVEGVLVKYVVVAQRIWWDQEGDCLSGVYIHPMDGDLPLSDQLGLMEFASVQMKHRITSPYPD